MKIRKPFISQKSLKILRSESQKWYLHHVVNKSSKENSFHHKDFLEVKEPKADVHTLLIILYFHSKHKQSQQQMLSSMVYLMTWQAFSRA